MTSLLYRDMLMIKVPIAAATAAILFFLICAGKIFSHIVHIISPYVHSFDVLLALFHVMSENYHRVFYSFGA